MSIILQGSPVVNPSAVDFLQPPSNDMGALKVAPPSGNQVSIDWLSLTLPDGLDGLVEFSDLLSVPLVSWVKQSKGNMGYRTAYKHPSGALLLLDGEVGMGSHCSLSGSALSGHFSDHNQILVYLSSVMALGGRPTRLDIAFDDVERRLNMDNIHAFLSSGSIVSRYKDARIIQGVDLQDGQTLGRTYYFGSVSSDSMIRIYDKWQESGQSGSGHWVRAEIQMRKRRARLFVDKLFKQDFRELSLGVLGGLISFRNRQAGVPRCECPVVPWWTEFLQGVERMSLGVARKSLEIKEKVEWFSRQCSKSLGQVASYMGAEFIAGQILRGISATKEAEWNLLGFVPCLDFSPLMKTLTARTGFSDFRDGRIEIVDAGGIRRFAF